MAEKYTTVEELRARYEREVLILGTEYHIEVRPPERDKRLQEEDGGYCDSTTKRIVLDDGVQEAKSPRADGDYGKHRERILRREIIHAFLAESGNTGSWWSHEDMVRWLSCMAPNLHAAFTAAGCEGGAAPRWSGEFTMRVDAPHRYKSIDC